MGAKKGPKLFRIRKVTKRRAESPCHSTVRIFMISHNWNYGSRQLWVCSGMTCKVGNIRVAWPVAGHQDGKLVLGKWILSLIFTQYKCSWIKERQERVWNGLGREIKMFKREMVDLVGRMKCWERCSNLRDHFANFKMQFVSGDVGNVSPSEK